MPTESRAKILENLKSEGSRRSYLIEKKEIDEGEMTVDLAFSSEEPYERWWGVEILGHQKKEIRLDRLKNGGAVLKDHMASEQTGVVEAVTLGDGVCRAKVRFSKNNPLAVQEFQDIKDGIRRHVSVGYRIHDLILVQDGDDGPVYRVTDWEPYEISIVSIPADTTVGVGRAEGGETLKPSSVDQKPEPEGKKQMTVNENTLTATPAAPATPAVDALAQERKRVAEILEIGRQHGQEQLAQEFVTSGRGADEFKSDLLTLISKGMKPTKMAPVDPALGMSKKEVQKYSIVRAIQSKILNKPEIAEFEHECSREAQKRLELKGTSGFYVPYDVMVRDLNVGTATAGGNLVATNLLAGSFIDLLRNQMTMNQLGITMLEGLVGNIAIPKQTGGATSYWVTEGNAPTESQATFGQVTMSPKTVGAFTDMTRELLMQSTPAIDDLVMKDLSQSLGLALDLAGIAGSGSSGQPRGVLNQSGIGSVAGGTDGAAPTYDHLIDLETAVSAANAAIGNLAYLTNHKVQGKLKKTKVDSGSGMFVWDRLATNAPLNGHKAVVSNQVPSNLVKGSSGTVCSAILFGNWSDLLLALWGALEIRVDPYTMSTTGGVRIVALQSADFAVRNAASFAAMQDALTA